jgi:hypothetical protein
MVLTNLSAETAAQHDNFAHNEDASPKHFLPTGYMTVKWVKNVII